MVGVKSEAFRVSLNEIRQLPSSGRLLSIFHLFPVGIDPSLDVGDRFRLHCRFKQVPEPALQLEILFNRLALGNVCVGDCSIDRLFQGLEIGLDC